ncbi:MAG: hypothetical protein LBL23_04485, partial [Coriobacteriales bacterium]|nr:hypothetical protein [Coriobacteriales bacterium]
FELRDWTYAVIATDGLLPLDEMGDETVMEGSIRADLFRNWAGEAPVLTDVATDEVETRVIDTFAYEREDLGINPGSFFGNFMAGLPFTGDILWLVGLGLAILAAVGIASLTVAIKKRKTPGEGRSEHERDA